MPIDVGTNKIGKINVGSSVIGKVYKGSELVYQNGLGMPVYGEKYVMQTNSGNLELHSYLFGSWSSNGISGFVSLNPIKTLTGTLGKSGSSVEILNDDNPYGSKVYPYQKTVTVEGFKFFFYYYDISGSGWANGRYMYVLTEKSAVGTYPIYPSLNAQWGEPYPINFTSNGYTVTMMLLGNYTGTRDSSLDFIWDGASAHEDNLTTLAGLA